MSVRFEPFVGPRFAAASVRLLIVGESHYGDPDPENARGATPNVVHMWQTRQWAIRYLTVGARVLTGLRAWEIDRDAVFAERAFYNFVQDLMPTVRHRPTAGQCRESWGAFREVLDRLDPTHVLATGQGFLWSNMPPSDRGADGTFPGAEALPRREYLTPSGFASATAIPHLSRASAARWHGPVRAFLACRQTEPVSRA